MQLDVGGGSGDIGKKISHGGGDGGDDGGDDDEYFDDFDDGEEGDEGGLFRRRMFLEEVWNLIDSNSIWTFSDICLSFPQGIYFCLSLV